MKSQPSVHIYAFNYRPIHGVQVPSNYVNIWAGKNLQAVKEGFQGDDVGDSISSKNRYYSELTGIYWMWKNTHQDYVGSCHYRRFFTVQPEPPGYRIKRWFYYPIRMYRKRYGLIYTQNHVRFTSRILQTDDAIRILGDYDAILPQRRKMRYTVREHYKRYHNEQDLEVVKGILKEKYPEYLPSFQRVLDGNRLYSNNMFVLPDHLFQEFMEWWFGILFEFEKQIDLSKYTGYQQRIMGFMGERLLNVWFEHKNLKVKELQVIYFKQLKKQHQ